MPDLIPEEQIILKKIEDLLGVEVPFSENLDLRQGLSGYEVDEAGRVSRLSLKDFDNIPLAKLSKHLEELPGLRKLSLRNNNIKEIVGLDNLDNLVELRLNNNQISEIKGLETLTALQTLSLHNNQISEIKGLETLTALQKLFLYNNQISEIKGLETLTALQTLFLDNNQISEIKGLETLTALQTLFLDGNLISEIKGLETLTALQILALDSNKISEIKGLETLTALQNLYLYNNQISEIKGLETLTALQNLYLDNNQISEIKGLETLTALQNLSLHNNQISEIKGIYLPVSLKALFLDKNPIKDLTLPDGENHIKLLREYLKRQSSIEERKGAGVNATLLEKTALHIIQLLLLGNGEAGKTSVLRALRATCLKIEEKDESNIEQLPEGSTHGNIHYYWNLSKGKNKRYLLVKDFGGQEYYHHFHPVFYHPNALYWIVTNPEGAAASYTKSDNGSFPPVFWQENIKHSLRYFHKEDDEVNAWLLLNKADMQNGQLDITAFPGFYKFFTLCSKKENINAQYTSANEQLYHALIEYMEAHTAKEDIMLYSKKIFEKLNSMSPEDKQKDISFTLEEFRQYLTKKRVAPAKILDDYLILIINDLRQLGLCIYIQPEEKEEELVYLFPQQLTQYIFENILTDKVRDKEHAGLIPAENLVGHEKLKELLEHFEVIFKDGDTKQWIAPQFLPKTYSDPELLEVARDGLKEKLTLRFKNYMPKGIMSRLIGYFGSNPYKKWYWRDGILFTHDFGKGKTKAMVTSDWNDFNVSIEATNKADLLAIFRKVLLSYFNKPVDLDDKEIKREMNTDEVSDNNNKPVIAEYTIKPTMSFDFIDMSLSINDGPAVPLIELKKRIESDNPKATFELMLPKADEQDIPETTLIKVHDYLPYIKDMIDTKKFEELHKPKRVFISYSHDDSDVCAKIKNHIRILERMGHISNWVDTLIDPGSKWDEEIEKELRQADIVLLLLSESFFASEYIWNKELEIINERVRSGKVKVVPVLCRHCLWHVRPAFKDRFESTGHLKEGISNFQAMPMKEEDGRLHPIHSEAFKYKDEAYAIIAEGLHKLVAPDK